MGQDQAEEGDLLPLPPQLHHRLAEVDLGMARRVMQWNEGLARRLPPLTDIVLHDARREKTRAGAGMEVWVSVICGDPT